MQLTGSQVIIECLKEQGVDTVFGYPGGAILNVYDELYKHPEIRHVLTSHEQGASHAADGYATIGMESIYAVAIPVTRLELGRELDQIAGRRMVTQAPPDGRFEKVMTASP